MITLSSVSRSFDKKAVLRNITHTFPDKGIFALMGPSGSGKTTLLRLLAGLDKPDGGSIDSTHRKTAMAFQEPRLLEWLNCELNLKLVLSNVENAPELIDEWLEKVELSKVKKELPKALSGGMQQRLSLARALCTGADLILLDEPFSALDKKLKIRLAPLLREASQSALVIMVTHDPAEAELAGATVLHCDGEPITALNA